jgi:hypothetical protein
MKICLIVRIIFEEVFYTVQGRINFPSFYRPTVYPSITPSIVSHHSLFTVHFQLQITPNEVRFNTVNYPGMILNKADT